MSAMTSQSIDSLVKQIRKQHGEDAIVSFTGDAQHAIPSMPTGSFGLDMALGIGGYPRGRIIEIYGPESSGKTTLALHAIAECQRAGGLAVFVDAEHALDPFYARRLGVDMQTLLISQPDSGEQAFDIVESLARSEQVSLIVVDSVAALTPRAELEGEMGDLQVGAQARMMSKALRKLTALTSKTGVIILFINQIRMKVGVVYGSPETTPGGQALKFFASVRLDVRKAAAIKNGEEIIGNRTRVKVVKNKVAAPFRQVEFDILFGGGVQRTGEVLDAAAGCGVVQKSGSWFMFGEERLGQGRDRVAQLLRDQPALAANIERLLRERGALPALINAPAAAGDAGFN